MVSGLSFLDSLPIIVGLLTAATGLFIRQSEHPKDAYKNEVERIQEDRWNDVCQALGPVVVDVYDYVNSTDGEAPDDLNDADRAGYLLRQALSDRGDLEPVEDQLARLDAPKVAYQECRRSRDRAVKFYGTSFFGNVFIFAALMLIPQSIEIALLEAALFTAALTMGGIGTYYAMRHWNRRELLDEMAEDLDFM